MRRTRTLLAAIAMVGSAIGLAAASPGAALAAPTTTHSGASEAVVVDGSPGVPVANPASHTLYVPIQCPTSACSVPSHVVDVINTDRCHVGATAHCAIDGRATVGNYPLDVVIDPASNTIYAINGDGTVTVVDGGRCDAAKTSSCKHPIATIKLGKFVVAGALESQTHTLYVASPAGFVFAIDVAHCTATSPHGCHHKVRRITDKRDPDAIAVDAATHSVYAADVGSNGSGDTLTVINANRCNATVHSGCGHLTSTTVGGGPYWVTVDPTTDTVYTANNNDGTVSVVDAAKCNASVTTGCHHPARTVTTGAEAGFVAVDPEVHTLFVSNAGDDTTSALNTSHCNGSTPTRCPSVAPSAQTAPNNGAHYEGFPNSFALADSTIYDATIGGTNIVTVTGYHQCDAKTKTGCRSPAPSVATTDDSPALDPATETLYVSNYLKPAIDVYDAATCAPADLSGCKVVAHIPVGVADEQLGAIDDTTHTLYAANSTAGKVQVLNLASCTATTTTGCDTAAVGSLRVASPDLSAIDSATHTLYVASGVPGGTKPNHIAVVDASTCNATTTTGCHQTPTLVKVGIGAFRPAVSQATNTIYMPNVGAGFSGSTMAVIDGSHCDAADQTDCAVAKTVLVGSGPVGVAIDDSDSTVYVTDNGDGDVPGQVSVINGSTCSGATPTGCMPVAAVPVGRSPRGLVIDSATHAVYVADGSSAAISIIDGSTCNATTTTSCSTASPLQAVDSDPATPVVDPATHRVFVSAGYSAGSLSVFTGTT